MLRHISIPSTKNRVVSSIQPHGNFLGTLTTLGTRSLLPKAVEYPSLERAGRRLNTVDVSKTFREGKPTMKAATMALDSKGGLPVEQFVVAKRAANTELLDLALKAHGGLERWNRVKTIKVDASITGAIWFVKGKGDVLKNVVLTAETRSERVTVDFPGQDKRAVFEPNRIVIEKCDGTLIEARDDPEKSFEGQQRETPWDWSARYFVPVRELV